ncbi:hypothetical protein Tco_0370782 [Tanacetum coccineum]
MQTQEDHSNPIPALNVDSLKVDLVVITNTCSEKEDSNSKTASSKSVKERSLNYATKDVHAIKYKMSKAKERCMAYFRSLHSHLQVLSKQDLKGTRVEHGFKRAFMSLFGQDVDTFTSTMLLNFTLDYDSQMTDKYFVEYTGIEVKHFGETLLQHMSNVKKCVAERTRHQRQHDRRVNKRQMQTQVSKIDTGKAVDDDLFVRESSGIESEVQDDNSRSVNDTEADDADIRPIYDEEPMAEVQLTAECNIFAIGKQHTEQPEIINEGRVDQYPEQRHVKSPMLDSSPDNQTTDYSKQSLESENILLKKTVAQFEKDFSRMKAHCIALELKYQNQALKSGQHGQILNETSNKAKIKKEIDVLEMMNIELEHKQTTSLLAYNDDLKAHIREKAFAIVALKNKLRKLKGNSVDTQFAKTTELGKPVSLPLRNQSIVRQPNAFKSERPQMSKPRESMNSSKNMPRFSSNDMAHNHYLDEARKKTQEKDRNSKASVMPSARFQSTADGSKPKPRSNNQTPRSLPVSKSSYVMITVVPKADHSKSSSSFSDSKHFVCSTCHKCVFNANHDACITKLLKEIFTRHRFSPNKTSVVYEKTSPRSDLRWKPTGRIFKSVGLRWIPTRKLFDSCTSKADSGTTHMFNVDIR